jgi:pyruvate-ferredoxin/flavodoxin oxidoreductase
MIEKIRVVGGRYGLGSKEFKPRDVKAVYENMISADPKHGFVVGIVDDMTGRSLKTDSSFKIESPEIKTALLYGIGSDGTVGAVKNIVKIVGDNSELYPQSYAVYDSKKSGGLTASHLRFSGEPIRSQYLVENSDFIAVSNFVIAQRFDVFQGLKSGGSVMINTGLNPDDAFASLPKTVQQHLIDLKAHVYFLDANRGAKELGLGNRINTFILINFFNITKVIDPEIAITSSKDAIEKTYKKKGMAVVEANWAAIDRAGEFLVEFKLPEKVAANAPDFIPSMTPDTPSDIARTLGEIAAQRGDDLTTSDISKFARGEFPVGTSKYEKRRISNTVASVDLEKCIQCGKCSTLCPHAAIRLNVSENPTGDKIKWVDSKTKELGDNMKFTLNISPADCTGCTVCVENCPVKALQMVDISETDQTAFDQAVQLPEIPREKLNLNMPKHIELLPHYFEFPGACAGCGETPYIKMLAHLFGDRMVVANATGCSSIYGANLPTTPWTKDKAGRGPAWSNSLFEDNAEYGLGMRLALNQKRDALKKLLFEIFNNEDDKKIETYFAEKDPSKQRQIIEEVKEKINKAPQIPECAAAISLLDSIVDKSVWIVGGDGWAYDIGYGGLDHILHSGQNVNILVLDTEGYSNTGGQSSKSTPFGASMKFAVGGKEYAKKDLGLIAMMSGAYVAQISLGANQAQAIKAFREAEAFNGPSIILAYGPCIAHGFALKDAVKHQENMVKTGAWPLYRFNPALLDDGKNPLMMDSGDANMPLEEFLKTENRFAQAKNSNAKFDELVEKAKANNDYRSRLKQHIADFAVDAKKDKGQG